jgi:hypothetical protein
MNSFFFAFEKQIMMNEQFQKKVLKNCVKKITKDAVILLNPNTIKNPKCDECVFFKHQDGDKHQCKKFVVYKNNYELKQIYSDNLVHPLINECRNDEKLCNINGKYFKYKNDDLLFFKSSIFVFCSSFTITSMLTYLFY